MSDVGAWTDTIAACITAPGRGAVAIVRLTGTRSLEVARKICPFLPGNVDFRHAYFGSFASGDEGLCIVFKEGASFTGELSAELNCHGSPVAVQQVLEQCYQAGARPAERGEFSLRAFLNGKIDLSQAEGIRETVEANTERQLNQANRLRQGRLAVELVPILDDLRYALTTVEALTDFSEELGDVGLGEKVDRLQSGRGKIENFLSTEAVARQIRDGILVVLAGRPNAGKSSLLNALIKSDRAIVTDVAGTTRDAIEEQISINGIPVRLVDTAGLRESDDTVEKLGIAKSRQYLGDADLILYLYDPVTGWIPEDEELFASMADRAVIVSNKADLLIGDRGIAVSAQTGLGLSELVEKIESTIQTSSEEPVTLVERHYAVMHEVLKCVDEALTTLHAQSVPDDLAAVSLRGALRLLGELTGESAPADVLEQIFSQFCIGK